jgi:hypothetical protein
MEGEDGEGDEGDGADDASSRKQAHVRGKGLRTTELLWLINQSE